MAEGFNPGIVIQAAEGYHCDLPFGIEARHLRAAGFAKHLGEVSRIGHLVKRQVIFTLHELDSIDRRKAVGRVRGGSRLAAPMAVAILHHLEWLVDLVFDGAAHTAAAHNPFRPGFERFFFHALHPGESGVIVVSGKITGNLKPGRAMRGEDMAIRLLTVFVAPARRHPVAPLLAGVRHDRATGAAETAHQQMRGAIAHDGTGIAKPVDLLRFDETVGGKRRTVGLAA